MRRNRGKRTCVPDREGANHVSRGLSPGHSERHFDMSTHAEAIAIVGIGCRFPGSGNIEAFWELLERGLEATGDVPDQRLSAGSFEHGQMHPPQTRLAGFLDQVDRFDAHFFGISTSEATRTDPQQRLALEVAWEALEDAGIAPSKLAGSDGGVFLGISTHDYERLQGAAKEGWNLYAATGSAQSIAANRLSYTLDLRGPSLAIDTACSSSLVAVHMACESLRRGESALALAGGVNVI